MIFMITLIMKVIEWEEFALSLVSNLEEKIGMIKMKILVIMKSLQGDIKHVDNKYDNDNDDD